jgi:hypothetical protein
MLILLIRLAFVLMMVALSGFISAQSTFDSIRCEHRISLLKKKALILRELNLTESQKSSFWPIYESYELATEFVEAEYSFLRWKFSNQFQGLNSHEQYELSAQLVEDEFLIARIRKQYFKKFRKAITAEQLTTFMQLDQQERNFFRDRMANFARPTYITSALAVGPR